MVSKADSGEDHWWVFTRNSDISVGTGARYIISKRHTINKGLRQMLQAKIIGGFLQEIVIYQLELVLATLSPKGIQSIKVCVKCWNWTYTFRVFIGRDNCSSILGSVHYKDRFHRYRIPIIKTTRSWHHKMGIPIPALLASNFISRRPLILLICLGSVGQFLAMEFPLIFDNNNV